MSQILLPWQRGSLGKKFAWHYLMVYPWNPPYRRKNFADIFYTSRVIANFVPKFVAMATRIAREKIRLAAFDGPSPKTPLRASREHYLKFLVTVVIMGTVTTLWGIQKQTKIYCSSLENGLTDFNNFWYKYSKHNWTS